MSPQETLSSRERVQLALNHQETDRIPIAMVCAEINPPAYRELERHLSVRAVNLWHSTWNHCSTSRRWRRPTWGPGSRLARTFGACAACPSPTVRAPMTRSTIYPLAKAHSTGDLARRRWPTTEWFDYSVLPDRIAAVQAGGEHCLMVTNGNIFESAWYMRGFEQIFLDLVLDPEFAHELMRRVTDFYVEHFRRLLAAAQGKVDLVFTADDIAGQQGLLMSLAMWEEFIKPYHLRLNRAIHELGAQGHLPYRRWGDGGRRRADRHGH